MFEFDDGATRYLIITEFEYSNNAIRNNHSN